MATLEPPSVAGMMYVCVCDMVDTYGLCLQVLEFVGFGRKQLTRILKDFWAPWSCWVQASHLIC